VSLRVRVVCVRADICVRAVFAEPHAQSGMMERDEDRQDRQQVRIDQPDKFRLADHDPAETYGLDVGKDAARALLAEGVKRLEDLQARLYAQDRWSVLAIFQAWTRPARTA